MDRKPSTERIVDIEEEIVEDFAIFDDWKERYGYVIELGKKLPPYPEEFRVPDLMVKGCQSQVWLHSDCVDGIVYFDGDSDAMIVRGLISLALRVYSGHTPEEILAAPPTFVQRMGLSDALSTQRTNGLNAVFAQIKRYAQAYAAMAQGADAALEVGTE